MNSHRRQRFGILALIAILLFNMISPQFLIRAEQADTPIQSVYLTDEKGRLLDQANHPERSVASGDRLYLNIEWKKSVTDQFHRSTMVIPDELEVEAIKEILQSEEAVELGSYQVTENQIILSFDQENERAGQGIVKVPVTLKELEGIGSNLELRFKVDQIERTISLPFVGKESEEAKENSIEDQEEVKKRAGDHGESSTQLTEEGISEEVHKETDQVREIKEKSLANARNEDENETTEIIITQEYSNLESDGSNKIHYYTDEDIVYLLSFELSGNETELNNYQVKIEMPKEFIEGYQLTPPELADEVRYEEEGDKYVVYMDFPQIMGGTKFKTPVQLKFKEKITPEGYELPISAMVLDDQGKSIVEADDIVFSTKYDQPRIDKEINNSSRNSQQLYGGIAKEGEASLDPDYVVPIPFTFTVNSLFGAKYREFTRVTITDQLPPYAEFDPDLNEGWGLSADGKTVSKTLEADSVSELRSLIQKEELWLTFPEAKLKETYRNEVEMTFEPINQKSYEPETKVSDEIEYYFETKVAGGYFDKVGNSGIADIVSEKRDLPFWSIVFSNPTGMILKDIVIEDFDLDSRMSFKHVEVRTTALSEENLKVIAVTESGEKELEREGIRYEVPSDTERLLFYIDQLEPYTRNEFIRVYPKFEDPSAVSYESNPADDEINRFYNHAKIEGVFQHPENEAFTIDYHEQSKNYHYLTEVKELVYINKDIIDQKDSYLVGDEITFELHVGTVWAVDEERKFKNAKFIDFLPDGLTPVESDEYEIIENYKNSGRTAVIFELGDLDYDAGERRYLKTIVNKQSEEGFNRNELYFIYEGKQLDFYYKDNHAADEYDLMGNGDTEQLINYNTVDYNYVPPHEVISRKYVKNAELNNWTTNGVITDSNGELEYKLFIQNNLEEDLQELKLYDVFPYEGDVSIVTNQDGDRPERGSMFSNQLTGPVQAPEGFTVYYRTADILEDETETIADDLWQTEVTSYEAVQAIKIVMDPGQVIPSKESVEFIVPMKAPAAKDIHNGDIAYNSFAISTNEGESMVEANKVYNRMIVEPTIEKDVEGKEHLEVDVEEDFQYNVKVHLPDDLFAYESLTITDELDERLAVKKAALLLEGEETDIEPELKGQKVSLSLDKKQLQSLAGKELVLKITAQIKAGTEIEVIDNVAQVQLNDRPAVDSNLVTVKPTPPEPIIPEPIEDEKPQLPEKDQEGEKSEEVYEIEEGSDRGERTVKAEEKEEAKSKSILPKTATDLFNLALIGLILVLFGGYLYIRQRKQA